MAIAPARALSEHERINELLQEIVGDKYVSDRPAERVLYSRDWVSTFPILNPIKPDFVVMPQTVEQVQRIVRLANRYGIPLVPEGANLTARGLCHPWEAGIVLDMRRMNKILEFNENEMYALLEPGVTWGDMAHYIQKYHPDFAQPGCHGPAGTTMLGCYLNWGMPNNSFYTGSSENIQGLEVVLPTGEIIRTGSAMVSPVWFGRLPLLDVTGLFIGAFGSTGIITKYALSMWPKLPKCDMVIVAPIYRDGLYNIVKPLVRANLGLEWLQTMNYGQISVLRGLLNKDIPRYAEKEGLPDFYTFATLTAYSEKEMEAKLESLEDICKKGGATIVAPAEELVPFLAVPGTAPHLDMLNYPGQTYAVLRTGGADYAGTYGPFATHADFYEEVRRVWDEKYDLPVHWYSRSMRQGHYNCIRPIYWNLDVSDHEEVVRVNQAVKEAARIGLKHGAVQYKPSAPMYAILAQQADAGSVEFVRRLQNFLDPNGIMNPGSGRI